MKEIQYDHFVNYSSSEFFSILDKLKLTNTAVDFYCTIFSYEGEFMIEEYWKESLTIKARNCSEYDAYNELFIIYSDGFFNYESAKKRTDGFFERFQKQHRFYENGNKLDYVNQINLFTKYIQEEFFIEKLKETSDKENVNFIFDAIFSKNESHYTVNDKVNSKRSFRKYKTTSYKTK